jgi:hypothetical protein
MIPPIPSPSRTRTTTGFAPSRPRVEQSPAQGLRHTGPVPFPALNPSAAPIRGRTAP